MSDAPVLADADQRARRRRTERHGAAVIRSIGRSPTAEFRDHRLRVDDRRRPFASPWLVADPAQGSVRRNRGVADALALRLRFSDPAIHAAAEPASAFSRVVFDFLEQLRCEALVPSAMAGARANLDAAFVEWAADAEAQQVGESTLGLLLYTAAIMARSRLIGPLDDEQIDATIETTRAHLSPHLGTSLAQMRRTIGHQAAFASAAREFALAVDQVAGIPDDQPRNAADVAKRTGLTIPAGWDDADTGGENHGEIGQTRLTLESTVTTDLDRLAGYSVYTRRHDREITGDALSPAWKRRRLRTELDRQIQAQAVSVSQLALRLQRLLGRPVIDGWTGPEEEGVLDPARLTEVVTSPLSRSVHRIERYQPTSPAVVAFLVDQSGSMKRQRFETVAVLVDTFCRALDRIGVATEVLGFTTGTWAGGAARADWQRDGAPKDPGRIADLLHIVYKDADASWRRSRQSIAAMADPLHFREGVDGEALVWAHRRLLARPEPRRLLVLISDGAPYETATGANNRPGLLDDHIIAVADAIRRQGTVELGSIGVDPDLLPVVPNSVPLDLRGTLGLDSYGVLARLFGRAARGTS